jgi:zinc protease
MPMLLLYGGENMRIRKSIALFFIIFLCFITDLSALESHVLKNGLEVFFEENHLVPLVNIRITFRAGAIVETPELNGLCHLYEHLLFMGNALYKNQSEFMAALNRMGVGNWNGGTSTELVTYYITVPSDRLEEGLEFWAYAVKSPLLSNDELVKEREVVHNEIAGKQSEPEYYLDNAVLHALYPDYWYRRDTGGDLEIIDTATVEKMKFIKNNFYLPNNAAIFISGDIDPSSALKAVKKHYGDWEKGPGFPDLPPHKPLKKDLWVAVDTFPSKGLASVTFTFRGPDTGIDTESTYAADLWGQMLDDPDGKFKNNMFKAVPELYGGTRHINSGYFTQRDGGTSSFSFVLTMPEEEGKLWDIISRLKKALKNEIALMAEKNYFNEEALKSSKAEIENQDILSRDTAAGLMSNLSFWWASTSTVYYLNYLENIRKVTIDDVDSFMDKYLLNKPFLTSIWINKEDDKNQGIVERVNGLLPKQKFL